MLQLSPARAAGTILEGLKLLNRGKVRDTYDLGSGLLLSVATDAVSIFDHVLNAIIPGKGIILTAMTHFWMTKLEEAKICKTHLVAAGSAIDHYLPDNLRGNVDLQSRALVVKQLQMVPIEFIARGYLTGSALKEYQTTGKVFGVPLPKGLHDGDKLPFVFDTPTTKEVEGHDIPMDAKEVRVKYPEETKTLLAVYEFVRGFAEKHGIIFADTKLEFGRDEEGQLVLGDEVATPDSSRFWSADVWRASQKDENRKAPPPYDKQLVRNWGIDAGVNNLDPLSPKDVKKVHGMSIPDDLIIATSEMYRYIFWLITGRRIDSYLTTALKIKLGVTGRKVAVVFGSVSDRKEAEVAIAVAKKYVSNGLLHELNIHVLSCHRNPLDLVEFTKQGCFGADVVVAAGGKAFALPGVLDAHLHANGWRIPVIGVAFGHSGSEELLAAELSISQIPGRPVLMDEKVGVYCNSAGLSMAIARAAFSEMPPGLPRVKKESQFFIED
ncbi:MAG: phosphoribosylaminoimidazolesuccinocarboxamide synthase [Candidatus Paceibacterota bacterium]|jgi:phosphoribosylaminoimidazole-succinocarboxamide synthase